MTNNGDIDQERPPEPGATLVSVGPSERNGKPVRAYQYWRGANGKRIDAVNTDAPIEEMPRLSKKSQAAAIAAISGVSQSDAARIVDADFDAAHAESRRESNWSNFADTSKGVAQKAHLRDMALSGDSEQQIVAATSDKTPPDALAALAKSNDGYLKWVVARNPSTTPDTLALLANDENPAVQTRARQSLDDRVDFTKQENRLPESFSYGTIIDVTRDDGVKQSYMSDRFYGNPVWTPVDDEGIPENADHIKGDVADWVDISPDKLASSIRSGTRPRPDIADGPCDILVDGVNVTISPTLGSEHSDDESITFQVDDDGLDGIKDKLEKLGWHVTPNFEEQKRLKFGDDYHTYISGEAEYAAPSKES